MKLTIVGSAFTGSLDLTDDASIENLRGAIIAAKPALAHFLMKFLSRGKTLSGPDTQRLLDLGVSEGCKVMLIATAGGAAPSSSAEPPPSASHSKSVISLTDQLYVRKKEVARTRQAAALLASRDPTLFHGSKFIPYFENQAGHETRFKPEDEKGLKQGMILHHKGATVISRALAQQKKRGPSQQLPAAAAAAVAAAASSSSSSSSSSSVASLTASSSGSGKPPPSPSPWALDEPTRLAYETGLSYLLESDEAFTTVSPEALSFVDNHARLCLDVVWLYFRLGDLRHLGSAAEYLARARAGFAASHGANLERLRELKGEGAAERVLYVRLALLEGVVALLRGDPSAATQALQRAQADCSVLAPDGNDIALLRAGFRLSRREAVTALRATAAPRATPASSSAGARGSGSGAHAGSTVDDAEEAEAEAQTRINRAVDWAFTQREKGQAEAGARAHRAAQDARARRLGSTRGGRAVDMALYDALTRTAGFADDLVGEALRQADNSQEQALQLLTGDPTLLLAGLEARRQAKELAKMMRTQRRAAAAASRAAIDGAGAAGSSAGPAAAGGVVGNGSSLDGDQGGSSSLMGVEEGGSSSLMGVEEAGQGEGGEEEEEEDWDSAEGSESEGDNDREDEVVEDLVGALTDRVDGASRRGSGGDDGVVLEDTDLQCEAAAIAEWLGRLHLA